VKHFEVTFKVPVTCKVTNPPFQFPDTALRLL